MATIDMGTMPSNFMPAKPRKRTKPKAKPKASPKKKK